MTLNHNAKPFVPAATQAALTLLDIQHNARTNDAIDGLLALNCNSRVDLTPVSEVDCHDDPFFVDFREPLVLVNTEYEYADAFNEYAQEKGLWGYPGAEHAPLSNEIDEMREQFDKHWHETRGRDAKVLKMFNIWSEIVDDFHDYIDRTEHCYKSLLDNDTFHDAWECYLTDVWAPNTRANVDLLAREYNWVGIEF